MSVEFDPVRLGRRRRGVEPVAVGVAVMTVAIVFAIAKPWDRITTSPAPAASGAAAALLDPSPTRTPVPTTRPTPSGPDWTAVAESVTPHEGWGIAAFLIARRGTSGIPVSPLAPRYVERWARTSTDATGGDMVYVNREDRSVAALGVTTPNGVRPRAVRIWRLHTGDELEWVDAARIDDEAANGPPLLVRHPLPDGEAVPWDAGRYRVDILTGGGIHRISVLIPDRFGNVPQPDAWTQFASNLVAATDSDPSGIQSGLFATVDGGAVSIPARESEALGEMQAWNDIVVAGGSSVASAYLPRATGLGVMLTSHAAVAAASIQRLAPDPLWDAPEATGGISNMRGRTPFVVFPAPDDGVWPPGVYALTVDWEDAAGPHHASWHVELRPGIS
ncbi:MAG TPA: hypothetical protein VF119_01210 [Candidatus Limnocylindrales bacterium]